MIAASVSTVARARIDCFPLATGNGQGMDAAPHRSPSGRGGRGAIMTGLGCLLLVTGLSLHAETLNGKVVAVADGDTVTVLDAARRSHKVRLAGIDAPEKAQAFGVRSKQSLSAMVFNKTVSVEWNKRDRYGRTLGKLVVDGVDANLAQIQTGMAWWYEKYRSDQPPVDQRQYQAAELAARAQRAGLWLDENPVPPWDWRRERRGNG